MHFSNGTAFQGTGRERLTTACLSEEAFIRRSHPKLKWELTDTHTSFRYLSHSIFWLLQRLIRFLRMHTNVNLGSRFADRSGFISHWACDISNKIMCTWDRQKALLTTSFFNALPAFRWPENNKYHKCHGTWQQTRQVFKCHDMSWYFTFSRYACAIYITWDIWYF